MLEYTIDLKTLTNFMRQQVQCSNTGAQPDINNMLFGIKLLIVGEMKHSWFRLLLVSGQMAVGVCFVITCFFPIHFSQQSAGRRSLILHSLAALKFKTLVSRFNIQLLKTWANFSVSLHQQQLWIGSEERQHSHIKLRGHRHTHSLSLSLCL